MTKRTVAITGASGGIGRACVKVFAQEGWIVIGIDRAPFEGEFPDSGMFIKADVAREKDWEEIKSRLLERISSRQRGSRSVAAAERTVP